MRKVLHIFQRKGKDIIYVDIHTTVLDTLKLMAEKNIGAVVIKDNGKYAGLLTERDYARKVILMGKSSGATEVSEIMSTGLPRITPDTSIDTCMRIMAENHLRYLPVFENDELEGIISGHDVIKEIVHSQQEIIDQLHTYINS